MDTTLPVIYEDPKETYTLYNNYKEIPNQHDYKYNHIDIYEKLPDGTPYIISKMCGSPVDTSGIKQDMQTTGEYTATLITGILIAAFIVVKYTNSELFDNLFRKRFENNVKRGMRDYYIKRNLPIPNELKTKIEIVEEKLRKQLILKIKWLKQLITSYIYFDTVFIFILFILMLCTIFYFGFYIQP